MIRADVLAKLRFLAEPIAWALGVLLFLITAFRISDTASLLIVAVLLLLALVAGVGFWISAARLKLAPSGQQKGVVLVDERRVGFFDPDHEGGFVDLEALMRLELRGAFGERSWVLYHEDGPPLVISQNAPGAEQLLDVFSVLSALSIARFSKAFDADADEVQLIWERAGRVVPKTIH